MQRVPRAVAITPKDDTSYHMVLNGGGSSGLNFSIRTTAKRDSFPTFTKLQ